jgi:hypothetical protein
VLAARRYHAPLAVMLVHSFSQQDVGHADFAKFLQLFGTTAAPGTVVEVATLGRTRLFAGWAQGESRFVS